MKEYEMNVEIITQKELYNVLPFKKTKINQLLKAGILPVTKIGRSYVTTNEKLLKWLDETEGSELFY